MFYSRKRAGSMGRGALDETGLGRDKNVLSILPLALCERVRGDEHSSKDQLQAV